MPVHHIVSAAAPRRPLPRIDFELVGLWDTGQPYTASGTAALAVAPSGRCHLARHDGYISVFAADGSALAEWELAPAAPYSVAFHRGSRELYVLEDESAGALRVASYSPSGRLRRSFPVDAAGGGMMNQGLAVDARSGTVYVANNTRSHVLAYSPEGELLREIGRRGEGTAELSCPFGLAVSASSGDIYVAAGGSRLNRGVLVYSPEGKFLRHVGEFGYDDGRLCLPCAVALDSTQRVYVTDACYGIGRFNVYSPGGAAITTVHSPEVGDPWLTGFKGIGVDARGGVYVHWDGQRKIAKYLPVRRRTR